MVKLNSFLISVKKNKRVRGKNRGGTCGRGHKGYKARSGSSVRGFEGGQTPIFRRLPMRGFNAFSVKSYAVVYLSEIISSVKDEEVVIDNNYLYNKNLIKRADDSVKIILNNVAKFENKLSLIKKVDVFKVSKGIKELFEKSNIEVLLNK